VSGRVRRVRINVRTCSTRLGRCRYAFDDVGLVTGLVREVGLLSGLVRRGRLNVGTCSARLCYFAGTCPAKSDLCLDVFGNVGLLSALFRNVCLVSVLVRRGRLSVGKCLARFGYCRDVSGEVGLVSGHVRRDRLSDGSCSVRSGLCRDLFGEVWLE